MLKRAVKKEEHREKKEEIEIKKNQEKGMKEESGSGYLWIMGIIIVGIIAMIIVIINSAITTGL